MSYNPRDYVDPDGGDRPYLIEIKYVDIGSYTYFDYAFYIAFDEFVIFEGLLDNPHTTPNELAIDLLQEWDEDPDDEDSDYEYEREYGHINNVRYVSHATYFRDTLHYSHN